MAAAAKVEKIGLLHVGWNAGPSRQGRYLSKNVFVKSDINQNKNKVKPKKVLREHSSLGN